MTKPTPSVAMNADALIALTNHLAAAHPSTSVTAFLNVIVGSAKLATANDGGRGNWPGTFPDGPMAYLDARIPGLRAPSTCPECRGGDIVSALIVHLNDHHGWTREAIADWLETLPEDIDLTVHERNTP